MHKTLLERRLKPTQKKNEKKGRLSAARSNELLCGCPSILELVVRKYNDGRETWGYACRCGKVYEEKGRLK